MNVVNSLGRFLFGIPMAIFGIFHFVNAESMAGMVPSWMPGGTIWVYLTGAALILAAVAIMIQKKDRLAAQLLGLMLLLFALLVHLPGLGAEDETAKTMSMIMAMKDIALAGGALAFAKLAKDPSSIA